MTQDELRQLIARTAHEGRTKLDLRDQKITELPPEIGQLTRLTWLDLSGNGLTAVPPEIGQLTRLTSLYLGNNQLTTVPSEISQLTSLTSLYLGGNRLTAVPEIVQLTRLTSLNLGDNRLTAVPPEIGQLTSLTSLNLSGNGLTAVPPEIGQLTRLTSLHLDSNQLTAVPPEIGQLTSLTSLYLGGNRLTAVPEIVQLTRLTSLNLGDNRLTAVPPEIGQLTSLTSLNLSGNGLTAVPPEIGQLTRLTSLHLDSNQLTAVPPEIGQLTRLEYLSLSNNQITMLPMVLRRLENLVKSSNLLTGNPLPIPIELLARNPLDVLEQLLDEIDGGKPGQPQRKRKYSKDNNPIDAYFKASRPLREAKLLLVGEGDVGKTATINRLLHNRFSKARSKTIGVDIHQWECGVGSGERGVQEDSTLDTPHSALRVNVWDFGGQEIYHATHQFFLTHRSLYLLVLDATKDEAANRLDYWLRHIQSFANDAPIILVVNKTDQHRLALDERSLLLKYPAIRSPIQHISCKTGAGIPQLRQAIEEALAALPHVNDWIPVTWFTVKEKLAATGKDFLPYESYVDLCEAEGITHEAAQRTLARFLHDLGAALHFHDDRRLAGTNVLNPEWVTGGIYAILNEPTLQERGILRLSDLDKILNPRRYPAHKHPFLLDIMGKFELAAPLADGQSYLIPGLLPKTRPDFPWPAAAPVALEYRYAILPAAVLSRLMVRLHHHTWQPNGQAIRWRNGLGITRDGCHALIVADPDTARLTIALDGPAPHRRHLLAVIRADLDEIHGSFARLEAKEWVPLPDKPGAATPYHALLNLEARGITTYYDPIHDVEIDVRALLDGLESPVERDERRLANVLREKFNKAELRRLAHDLGIDHENLPGETKTDLARELALQCQRQGRLAELAERVGRERPLS